MSCLYHPFCSHWTSRARARLRGTLGIVFGDRSIFGSIVPGTLHIWISDCTEEPAWSVACIWARAATSGRLLREPWLFTLAPCSATDMGEDLESPGGDS